MVCHLYFRYGWAPGPLQKNRERFCCQVSTVCYQHGKCPKRPERLAKQKAGYEAISLLRESEVRRYSSLTNNLRIADDNLGP